MGSGTAAAHCPCSGAMTASAVQGAHTVPVHLRTRMASTCPPCSTALRGTR